MDDKFLQICQKKLLKEKEKVANELKKLNKRNDYGTSEDANIHEFEEREERLGLGKKLKDLQSDIDKAIKKIDKGKYGFCEACDSKIETGRLKVYPTALFCATCAAKPKYRVKKK